MLRDRLVPLLCCLALTPACGAEDDDPSPEEATTSGGDESEGSTAAVEDEDALYTYWRDAKTILDARCGSCHRPDDIAPFPLTTYEEVAAVAAVLPASITAGTMPPWPPSDDCQPYAHSRALDPEEIDLLLTWIEDGAPEGDPADAPPEPDETPDDWSPALSLEMPEPYTPTVEPDDHRCFLVPWPETETRYITGYRVVPGNRSIVHHVIVFNAEASAVEELQALDEADPGPGFACFGGAGAQANWVGSWVPGSVGGAVPEGTGMEIQPGSMMVIQLHYNTLSSAPAPDQTGIQLELADEVEHPAVTLPFTNFQWVTGSEPMLIPAGDPEVTHDFDLDADHPLLRQRLASIGLQDGQDFVIHSSGLHMHQLGTKATLSIVRGGQDEDCVLDIPRWDFDWQGGYTLQEPTRVAPEDDLRITCTWDNSEANQPVIDGELQAPRDVQWGDGTSDEMCLGVFYVTAG